MGVLPKFCPAAELPKPYRPGGKASEFLGCCGSIMPRPDCARKKKTTQEETEA